MKTKTLVKILALLGFGATFTACPSMYGSPTSDWTINGTVTDEAGSPIQGIAVTTNLHRNYDLLPYDVLTDNNGCYTLFGGMETPRWVAFDDIDGDENGGQFDSAERPVVFVNSDFKGGSGWYEGKATKTVDMVMELSSEE